jgi:hypothetical protein
MIERRYAEGTIPQPTNGRIGPFGNSEIRALIHACVQAKSLNASMKFVTRRLYRTMIHATSQAMGRGRKSIPNSMDGRDVLPTSHSMAHLGAGGVVSLRDEREANG